MEPQPARGVRWGAPFAWVVLPGCQVGFFWGGSPQPSCAPLGEAEAGVPGAAAGEAAGAVAVPGLPAMVCGGQGRLGGARGFWGGVPVGADPPCSVPPHQITFVDFVAYDVLDQHRLFVPNCPELQGNLGQFLQRFEVSGGHPAVSVPDTPVSLSLSPQCPCPGHPCVPILESPVSPSPRPRCPHPCPQRPNVSVPIPDTPVSPAPSLTPWCPCP